MSFRIRSTAWLALASLIAAGAALAQSGAVTTESAANMAMSDASASAGAAASVDASSRAELDAARQSIEHKAARVSAKARARAQAQLEASAASVNQAAQSHGDAAVAARLADEFRVDAGTLKSEHDALGCTWGDLVIAHTLQSNANTDLSAAQLVELNHSGMSWGQVAAGLGLEINSVIRGVQSETRVATGQAKADGRVAVMSGAGARVGLGTKTGIGVGVGNGTGVNVGTGVGVGVKVGKK